MINLGLVKFSLQVILTICAVALSLLLVSTPLVVISVALFGVMAMSSRLKRFQSVGGAKWFPIGAMVCLLMVVAFLIIEGRFNLDLLHSAIPLLCAFIAGLAYFEGTPSTKVTWRRIGILWAYAGSGILIGAGYMQNDWMIFHAALLFTASLFIACLWCFRIPAFGRQVLVTLLLLTIGLPVADWVVKKLNAESEILDLSTRPYSYSGSAGYPVKFKAWWLYYLGQMEGMGKDVYMRDPAGILPFALKNNSTGQLFGATVRINSHGFRGPEVSPEKKDAYRIVTIGESTTFGLNIGTTPWPELLEQTIAREIAKDRAIEVINAGVPAYTLHHNLTRLQNQILPLQPDMIISYHGINGFHHITQNLPPMHGQAPPTYAPRPLKLLADCEYRMKLRAYSKQTSQTTKKKPEIPLDPMQTEFANQYRELIQFAQSNSIQLVLSSFSMAVNRDSPKEVVEFYRSGFGNAYTQIRANQIHTEIVKRLIEEHPSIIFIDTQPGLDGHHENFIDLIHFNEAGEELMAKAFFNGIGGFLKNGIHEVH